MYYDPKSSPNCTKFSQLMQCITRYHICNGFEIFLNILWNWPKNSIVRCFYAFFGHDLGHFGSVLDNMSSKIASILLKLAPEVGLNERNVMLKFLWESPIFTETVPYQSLFLFSFSPTSGPIYRMKEAKIEKNKSILSLNLGMWLSRNRKIKAVPLLPFNWKTGLLFAFFGHFWVEKGMWSREKGSESKFDLPYCSLKILLHVPVKNFCHSCSQLSGYRDQRSCFFQF